MANHISSENNSIENMDDKEKRRRRRSSFINRKKNVHINPDLTGIVGDESEKSKEPQERITVEEGMNLYYQKLNNEVNDWKTAHSDAKYEYKQNKLKTRLRFLDESLLNSEEKDFLKDTEIYTRVVQNMKILYKVATQNKKLNNMVLDKKIRLCNFYKNEVIKINHDIYKVLNDIPIEEQLPIENIPINDD